jgi:CubicO group peptidase (beta-lactamase class C family)
MKAARLIWLVCALAFLVNRSGFSADVVCDNNGCISISKFAANISQALNNNVVGYVGTIGSQVISGGYARTGADAPVPMNPNFPSSVASLSKTLTAIGVLKELVARNLTIDDYIYPFLPPGWGTTSTGAPAPNVNTITFRQLLTHTSGFRSCVDPSAPQPGPGGILLDQTYAGLQWMVQQGISLPTSYFYSNCNFALFRVLLPQMLGNIQNTGDPAADTAQAYVQYMQQAVFQPLGITDAQCGPEGNMIYSYPNPAGDASGNNWNDSPLRCGGAGWVLSVNDLSLILNDLIGGNTLLSYDQKLLMNLEYLGWDSFANGSACGPPTVCKNGSYNFVINGADVPSLWAYLGIFKCTVPVVVVANSQITNLPDTNIIGLVETAYDNAAPQVVPPGTPALACPPQLFTLSASSLSIAPGQTDVSILGQAAISGWPNPANIAVSISGLPSAVSATWTQLHGYIPPDAGVSGALQFSATPNAFPGQQDVEITATSGSLSYSQYVTLTIGGVCKPVTSCYPGQCGSYANGCSGIIECGGCPTGTYCEGVCIGHRTTCPPGTHSCGNGVCTKYVCQ